MADFNFDTITQEQAAAFNPAVDRLFFSDADARNLVIVQNPESTVITRPASGTTAARTVVLPFGGTNPAVGGNPFIFGPPVFSVENPNLFLGNDAGNTFDAGDGNDLDAVFRDRNHAGGLDDFRIDADLDRFQHIASREVDGGGSLPGQVDVGPVRRDEGRHDPADIAAGQVVRFHLPNIEIEARLAGTDVGSHDVGGIHLAQPHPDQRAHPYAHAREQCRDPAPLPWPSLRS